MRAVRPGACWLFAQIFERDLDALIIELLILGAELIAAIGGAVEKLRYHPDRDIISMTISFAFDQPQATGAICCVDDRLEPT